MNDPTQTTLQRSDLLIPQQLISIYTGDLHYVEIADVREDGSIATFRPMSVEEAIKLGGVLVQKNTQVHIGRIPPTLLYMDYDAGQYTVIWYTYPERNKLYFAKALNINDGYVNLPAMVWKYVRGTLYLYTMKVDPRNKRITGDERLYHAPFHNIHDDSSVCLGSGESFIISGDTSSVMEFIKSVEKAFYKSRFTTMHCNPLTAPHNLNLVMKELIGSDKPFPVDIVKPTKFSLDNIISNNSYARYSSITDDSEDEEDYDADDEDTDNG